jgi:predicted AAA+ superfamily ATPase
MRPEFQHHNLFIKSIDFYLDNDPNLAYLKSLKYVLEPELLEEIPLQVPGIYILTGARQVGKSTLLKLLIKQLLLNKTCAPGQIFYLPCDIIVSFHELITEIEYFLTRLEKDTFFYIFIDEVTYVREWDRAIKYFADLGYFRRGSVLITGSDSTILVEGMKRFPGRRGTAADTDFQYYPLSFSQYILLVEPSLEETAKHVRETGMSYLENPLGNQFPDYNQMVPGDQMELLKNLFNRYLVTGGFLTAINELAMHGNIDRYVYNTYVQWIIGDFLKRNKKENFLKEIILALSERLGSQISFQNITAVTDIRHHSTTQEYLQVLTDMDVLFILEALKEDKLTASPKKQKKVHFSDPFIAAAMIGWARGIYDYWEFAEKNILQESPLKAELIEGVIASLFRRKFKSFYIKSEAEVDLSVITGNTFLPVEIKNSARLRKNDLKQILKYKTGLIGYNGLQTGRFEQLHVLPLPLLALFI